ncbi:MAG TPA: PAS domain S-box protein, partial [Thioploca sp.]|nr:PAS domain S-box protein [Thioploca sp.]
MNLFTVLTSITYYPLVIIWILFSCIKNLRLPKHNVIFLTILNNESSCSLFNSIYLEILYSSKLGYLIPDIILARPEIILIIINLIFVILIIILIRWWFKQTSELKCLIKQQTKELKQYKEQLRSEIKGRKIIESQLKKLSIIIEQSPSTTIIVDIIGNIEYVNPKFTQITGYSAEEAIGRNPRILKSGQHTKEFYQNMWDTILYGEEWRNEFHNRKKDGSLYWEYASISTIKDKNGNITNFIKVAEDITERKQAEQALQESKEQLHAILNNSATVIFLKDMSGRYLFINKRYENIFNISNQQMV